ncbi:unnamed protein product [Cuscuta campestris]|uniref:Uncharacterized protein n=1 Tax=Cuscuta campestris TaxID=132261 RepID=A0A484LDJ1_9ASTE|nr:unnamed protein product [Cuscuta campestris]
MDPLPKKKAVLQRVTLEEVNVLKPTPRCFPILKLVGIDSSIDKKCLMWIFDEKAFVAVEEGHRDKRPKIHHNLLLLPHVHRSELLGLYSWSPIPSVERITVKDIKHLATCAKINGKVIAYCHRVMQVLYRRGPSESEEKRRGEDFKLKGPHCSALEPIYGITIGIKPFEDRGDGEQREFLLEAGLAAWKVRVFMKRNWKVMAEL